jgi:hypothetical protein
MTTEERDRAMRELADAARARVEGFHGGLDSSVDLLPVCSVCSWCHTTGSPAGVVFVQATVGVGN